MNTTFCFASGFVFLVCATAQSDGQPLASEPPATSTTDRLTWSTGIDGSFAGTIKPKRASGLTAFKDAVTPAGQRDWLAVWTAWEAKHGDRYTDSGDVAWGESYVLRMYVNLYEAFGDRKWLDKLVDHADRVFAKLQDEPPNPPHARVSPKYRDGFYGFGQSRYEQYAPEYTEWLCDDGLMIGPILQFVELVWNDASLHTAYKGKADRYLELIERKIVEKWRINWAADADASLAARDRGYHVYEWSGWQHQPLNMFLAFADPLATLDRLARSPHYRPTKAELPAFYAQESRAMLEFFRAQLRPQEQGDCYIWKYGPTSCWPNLGEDVGHAFIDIQAALQGMRNGIAFTETDLKCMARTFTRNVWNGRLDTPAFHYYVDGKRHDLDHTRGHHGFGFLYLARYEPAIRDAFAAYYARYDFKESPPHVAVTAAMLAIADKTVHGAKHDAQSEEKVSGTNGTRLGVKHEGVKGVRE